MALDAPVPERWYLSLAEGAPVPDFADPSHALGADLFSLLPTGPEGKRWRALFNEAQVLLHQHPRNAERVASGRAPVNALWFWGAGKMPHAVRSDARAVLSEDVEMLALARLAGRDASEGDTGLEAGVGCRIWCLPVARAAAAVCAYFTLDKTRVSWPDSFPTGSGGLPWQPFHLFEIPVHESGRGGARS